MSATTSSSIKNGALTPEGAPFLVGSCEFHPGKRPPIAMLDIDLTDDKINDWPMIYILANDEAAYVGQTGSIANRMEQHGTNAEKQVFTTANIIFNEEFNTSVITDYEHRLIGYMHGDGRYQLTNKNEGMTDANYFSKAEYSQMFEELWAELKELKLVEHSIEEIEESEIFKYSPYKGLTTDQQVALDTIMEAIKKGFDAAEPLVVTGMPGTGKTVLAIYLLKRLKDDPKYASLNIRIMEPVTSLRQTLRSSLKGVVGLTPDDIIGPGDLTKPKYGYVDGKKDNFDILLVDEAHKLKQRTNLATQYGNYDKANKKLGLAEDDTQLDWIIDQAKLPIFFYDPLQAIGPSCLDASYIRKSLGHALEHPITLDTQMRVKGGKDYLEYIQEILEGKDPARCDFDDYDLALHESFKNFVDSFEKDYQEHDLSRMIAGYAWKWKTKGKKDPELYDIEFDGIGLRWNCTYDNWVGKGVDDETVAHEVGCIHSIQGYDLSYAYVIIGEDLQLDEETGQLKADKDHYYDRNGKATASPEELTQYIKNIYYVLLTRGIYGTHIYVADPKLRDYFARFIPSVD